MLVSLSVENWKSIESATLNIDTLSVLIGTNSSGKSNVLDALSFLNRVSSGAMLTAALQGDSALKPMRGGLEWAARKPGERFAIGVVHRTDQTQDLVYRIECETSQRHCQVVSEKLERVKYRIDKKGHRGSVSGRIQLFWTDDVAEESPTVIARIYNSKRGTPRQLSRASPVLYQLFGQKAPSEVEEGVELLLNEIRNIFILDPIPSHMRDFSSLSDRLSSDAGNIAGVLAALPVDERNKIEGTLTKYASQLPERDISKVFAETVGKFNSDAMLYCEEAFGTGKNTNTIDARGMSDGALRFLGILTALLTRPRNSLLVVEEIDNGLHPSRSNLLLRMLRDIGIGRSVDVVVTTHNPALLDAMGTTMVPFITVVHRDNDTGYTVLTLLEDIDQLPKLLAQGTVGRLTTRGLIEGALNPKSRTVG